MNFRLSLRVLAFGAIVVAAPVVAAQQGAGQGAAAKAGSLPAFEVATIKRCDPNVSQPLGFYSRPGGRVLVGCSTVKMLIYFAFGVPEERIDGGSDWVGSERYDVAAIPPDSSPSRTAAQPAFAATPSVEQRQMLQALLRDRFRLQSHAESREGEVYVLSLRSKDLQLKAPKDALADSRGNIGANGQAFGEDVSMTFLAELLTRKLGLPVLDRTGLTGKYDFELASDDPENKDMVSAVFDAMHRLGLEVKKGKGPVETLVIDHVERPSEN